MRIRDLITIIYACVHVHSAAFYSNKDKDAGCFGCGTKGFIRASEVLREDCMINSNNMNVQCGSRRCITRRDRHENVPFDLCTAPVPQPIK